MSASFTGKTVPSARIPAFSYLRQWKLLQAELIEAFQQAVESGSLIQGEDVSAFEREFGQYTWMEYAVGVASGTDAIQIALRALNIGPGDEVITTANGPVPTAAAIANVGARPRFVDIDLNTFQMSPKHLAEQITPRTKAVIVVHLYGLAAPLDEIRRILKPLLFPSLRTVPKPTGHVTAISMSVALDKLAAFHSTHTKNLGALGDGGMVVTNDASLSTAIREVANYGYRHGQRIAYRYGYNSRLDNVQAAMLRVKLRYLDSAITRRVEIASAYRDGLKECNALQLPAIIERSSPSWHQCVLRSSVRDELLQALAELGVQCNIHYPHPLHRMPAFALPEAPPLPHTETACREVFSLPLFPELDDSEVHYVIEACQASAANQPLPESPQGG